jgi:ATP-binding cassette subfamily B protein
MVGPVVRAKDARGTLGRLWGYLKQHSKALALAAGLVVVTSILGLAGPFLLGYAIDSFLSVGDLGGLARTALLMLVIYVVDAAALWLQNYVMAGVSQRTVQNLRDELFAKLHTLSLRYFDQRTHGELMSRLTNDVENINNVLTSSATQIVSSLISLVGVAVMMVVVSPPMAAVTLVVLPISTLVTQAIAKRTRKAFSEQQERLGNLNGIIEETVTGHKVVKAYVREPEALAQLGAANQSFREAATQAQILTGFMGPVMNMVNNLSLAIVAGTGGLLAVQGIVTVGAIASFVSYARQFTRPISSLAQLYNTIQSALAGAERVFEILDEEPEMVDTPESIPVETLQGDVVLDDVSFAYEPGTPVLKHVSLHAAPGETIALVGPTGAGKTTIANLLTRFYDIDEGVIRIDGIDIRQYRRDELRTSLGLVLQDNFLFGDTVMENIRYGRLDATDEEVKAAAVLANADQFIHRLPQGYQTVLVERGANLSHGQRQLLAIARAILADPSILILDEATSNVDTRTERTLQAALLTLMKGRTSFVIAHRLSTIREADEVLVINHGEVIERGNHNELLAQRGFYHHLYMSQFKGRVPEPA